MTKTTKAMLAGAALAGLFAGTGAAVKASTLLPSLKTSLSTQDPGGQQHRRLREQCSDGEPEEYESSSCRCS